ncbi:hypothetical protein AVEN_100936-1, partial [Araneus ventricosus]
DLVHYTERFHSFLGNSKMIIPAVVAALVLGVAFDEPSLTTKPYYIFDPNAINNSLVVSCFFNKAPAHAAGLFCIVNGLTV